MPAAHPNMIKSTEADIARLTANIAKVESRTEAIRAKGGAAMLKEFLATVDRLKAQLADLNRLRDKMLSPEYDA